jgi:hypothetical protein
MGASAPSPTVSWPCPLEGHSDIQRSGVPSTSCQIPCAYNLRETLSIDGADSRKSSKELPKAVGASFALEDLSVHQRARVQTEDGFLATPTLISVEILKRQLTPFRGSSSSSAREATQVPLCL